MGFYSLIKTPIYYAMHIFCLIVHTLTYKSSIKILLDQSEFICCTHDSKVLAIFKAEKGDSVGHHPNVATTTVIIGLSPRTIFIFHCQDFVRRTSGMRSSIVSVSMIP